MWHTYTCVQNRQRQKRKLQTGNCILSVYFPHIHTIYEILCKINVLSDLNRQMKERQFHRKMRSACVKILNIYYPFATYMEIIFSGNSYFFCGRYFWRSIFFCSKTIIFYTLAKSRENLFFTKFIHKSFKLILSLIHFCMLNYTFSYNQLIFFYIL